MPHVVRLRHHKSCACKIVWFARPLDYTNDFTGEKNSNMPRSAICRLAYRCALDHSVKVLLCSVAAHCRFVATSFAFGFHSILHGLALRCNARFFPLPPPCFLSRPILLDDTIVQSFQSTSLDPRVFVRAVSFPSDFELQAGLATRDKIRQHTKRSATKHRQGVNLRVRSTVRATN